MQQHFERAHFDNGHEWQRFIMLWLTIFLWASFLVYMLLFHYLREFIEPSVMGYFNITNKSFYQYAEIKLFTYLLWSCCIVSILAIINTWGIKRRQTDKIPDKYLIIIMASTVLFAIYYAKTDLNYLNGQLSVLAPLFGD